MIVVATVVSPVAAQTDQTVDLRVLVISVGDPGVDPGLDLIDDVLDEVGVAYDVLNSSAETLDDARLRSGTHGRYNGVIITVADTYLPGVGGAGLSYDEWTILHSYERDFGVNEAVLSGWPSTGGTPNYGMTNMVWAGSSATHWTPASDGTVFDYVNRSNKIQLSDFALSAAPRGAEGDPVITPYLVDESTPGNTLVSHLAYPDGREVLLSTATNAWFLDYSQTLAYAFVDFATSGLHLGSRTVKLAAHIDDLFLSADTWDPVANQTVYDNPRRNTAHDITTTVAAQNALENQFSTIDNFSVDWAFNGYGVPPAQAGDTTVDLPLLGDTFINENAAKRNYSGASTMEVRGASGTIKQRQTLLSFDTSTLTDQVDNATLQLQVVTDDRQPTTIEICPAAEAFDVGTATWLNASGSTRWTTGGGAASRVEECIAAATKHGQTRLDITPIVQSWASGSPNHGLVLRPTDPDRTRVKSMETSRPPRLSVTTTTPAQLDDELVAAIVTNAGEFRFLNHTFTHRDMDATAGTTRAQARDEINQNRAVWAELGLPELSENTDVVVTGNHSGLEDDNGTELDTSDDIHYPDGINQQMIQGFNDTGIRYLASDTSRPNTDTEQYLPNSSMVLLPRYPTSVFYNTTTPELLQDEYNYIFHERYIEAGQDPCTIPGAICTPRNYDQILDAEADTAVRHMLSYSRYPHYFHIANVVDYDGNGSTLLFDWLTAIATEYESRVNLPILNLPYHVIAKQTRQSLERRSADITATLNLTTGEVTMSSSKPVTLEVTGLSGGTAYGNKLLSSIDVSTTPVTKPKA